MPETKSWYVEEATDSLDKFESCRVRQLGEIPDADFSTPFEDKLS